MLMFSTLYCYLKIHEFSENRVKLKNRIIKNSIIWNLSTFPIDILLIFFLAASNGVSWNYHSNVSDAEELFCR